MPVQVFGAEELEPHAELRFVRVAENGAAPGCQAPGPLKEEECEQRKLPLGGMS
jgi:hypothetical protein